MRSSPRFFLTALLIAGCSARSAAQPAADLSDYKTVADAITVKAPPAPKQVAQPGYVGIRLEAGGKDGPVIAEVDAQSPAAAAGLQPGDVVRAVDGKPFNGVDALRELILARSPGETLKLSVQRKRQKVEAAITLAPVSRPMSAVGERMLSGVRMTEREDGIVVDRVMPRSPLWDAGVQNGDVIVKVDDTTVGARQPLGALLSQKTPGESVTLAVRRFSEGADPATRNFKLTIPSNDEDPNRYQWDTNTMRRWSKPVYRLAVITIEYPDQEHSKEITPEAWEKALFSSGTYNDKSASGSKVFGSLNDYYLEQSCGAFHVEGKCFAPVKVDRKRADYLNDRIRTALLGETLDKLLARDGSDTLANFDGVLFVYAGARVPTNRGALYWPHRSQVMHNGKRWPYVIIPEGGLVMTNISVVCHEFGHLLGLPDLYARPENPGSTGLGVWCAMSQQNGNGRPQHFSAWCKEQLGWLKPAVLDPSVKQKLILSPVEGSPTECYKVLARADGSEYFLLENRTKQKFDTDLPAEGLLIWRVVEGHPILEESHGIGGPAGPGSFLSAVPFPSKSNAAFTPYTTPSSRSLKGGGLSVNITNIQRLPDGRIAFEIGYEYL